MNDESFTLTFTTAELFCAATALGIAVLPLPTEINSQPTGVAIQSEIKQGYSALQQRGLIQEISPTQWQVNNLLSILVHWLAAPDGVLRLEAWQSSGERCQAFLFFWEAQGLWLQSTEKVHQFTFFKAADGWLEYGANWIGWLVKPDDQSVLLLPQVNLAAVLPKVRQDATSMEPMMQRAGLSSEAAQQTLARLATVDKVVTLTWQCGPDMAQKVIRQDIVLGAPKGTWGGSVGEADELVVLQPFSKNDLIFLLGSKIFA